MPSLRCRSGQASLEYVGVLALLVLVLSGAGAAVAAPDLPGAVVHHVRVALCMVGGDVCRDADARARGLEPCVTVDNEDRTRRGVSLAFVRVGRDFAWGAQQRSDGTISLTYSDALEAGATGGAGLELGPAVDLAAGGHASVSFRRGDTWELPSLDALERVMAGGGDVRDRLPAPTHRFVEGGTVGDGDATVEVGEGATTSGSLAGAATHQALGRRIGGGRTTYYYDGGADLSTLLPGAGASGRAIVELTSGSPPTLTVRSRTELQDRGRMVEHVGRMPLTDGVVRAGVLRILGSSPAPAQVAARVPAVADAIRRQMTWQRFTYAVERDADGSTFSVGFGAKLGHDREDVATRRRLVDAELLGPAAAQRRDCLGV